MFNPWYVRAAIEANTGVRLTLDKTVQYLFEEGLISEEEANEHRNLFPSYGEYFDVSHTYESDTDFEYGLPENSHSLED